MRAARDSCGRGGAVRRPRRQWGTFGGLRGGAVERVWRRLGARTKRADERERARAARLTVVGLRARKSGRFVQRTRSAGTTTAGESTFHSVSTSSRRPTSSKHATHARPNGLYYIDSCTEQNGGHGPRVLYTRPECKNGDFCSSTEKQNREGGRGGFAESAASPACRRCAAPPREVRAVARASPASATYRQKKTVPGCVPLCIRVWLSLVDRYCFTSL